jgi:hypothetical protein
MSYVLIKNSGYGVDTPELFYLKTDDFLPNPIKPLNHMLRPHTGACYSVREPVYFTCALETRNRQGLFFHTANQKFTLPRIRTIEIKRCMVARRVLFETGTRVWLI